MNELFASPEAPDPNPTGLWADMPMTNTAPPSYRVLARKYRPTTFDQLIGQEAMVRTLTNAIDAGRLPHAWMLTGVRGIGKTTTARIIARALNCTGPDGKGGPTIKPCGVCDACRTITEDRNVDVMEMDAASRTGVDDVREIVDGVRYGPASSRYKIYILDEVHMLTKNAFNALLKTLEEPPPHTKFIFATTEIRKVPVTVLSRCQRFDLRRIDSAMLAKHFMDVADWEKVEAEAEAIKLIANAADGSVRDGLSLLDQAIARGNGAVKSDDVKDMLGLADRAHIMGLCRNLLRGDVKSALDIFSTMQQAGSDPLQVLQDMCDLVHMLTRGQVVPDFAKDQSLAEYDRQLLTELSDIKLSALTRVWQILLKGIIEVQSAQHPAQAAEMVLIRLAYASELPPPGDLIKQLKESSAGSAVAVPLQAPSSNGDGSRAKITSGGASAVLSPAVAPKSIPQIDVSLQPAPTNYKDLVTLFATNREGALHGQLYSNVSVVRCAAGILEIRVGPNAPPNLAHRLGQCLTNWTGQRWMVSITDKPGEMTLLEQDKAIEQKRNDAALAHPLTQAVMNTFPGAKMTALRQRIIAPGMTASDDVVITDDFSTTNLED